MARGALNQTYHNGSELACGWYDPGEIPVTSGHIMPNFDHFEGSGEMFESTEGCGIKITVPAGETWDILFEFQTNVAISEDAEYFGVDFIDPNENVRARYGQAFSSRFYSQPGLLTRTQIRVTKIATVQGGNTVTLAVRPSANFQTSQVKVNYSASEQLPSRLSSQPAVSTFFKATLVGRYLDES